MDFKIDRDQVHCGMDGSVDSIQAKRIPDLAEGFLPYCCTVDKGPFDSQERLGSTHRYHKLSEIRKNLLRRRQ